VNSIWWDLLIRDKAADVQVTYGVCSRSCCKAPHDHCAMSGP